MRLIAALAFLLLSVSVSLAAKVAYVMGGLGCPVLQPISIIASDLHARRYIVHLGCYFDGPRFLTGVKANVRAGNKVLVVGHSMGAWAVGWMSSNYKSANVRWIGLDPLFTGATTSNGAVLDIWEAGYPMGGRAKNTHIYSIYGHIFFPDDPQVRNFVIRNAS